MMNRRIFAFSWLLLGIFFFLVALDLYHLIPVKCGLGTLLTSKCSQLFFFYILAVAPLWVLGAWGISRGAVPARHRLLAIPQVVARLPRWLRYVLTFGLLILPSLVIYHNPTALTFSGYWLRLFLILAAVSVAALLLRPAVPFSVWLETYFSLVILAAVIFLVAGFLDMVTAYPFSLSWSEGNRLWDYSVLFGADRYIIPQGKKLDSFAVIGRKFFWGLPFLFPRMDIVGVRLWNELVKVWPYLLLPGLLLFGRWKTRHPWRDTLLFAAWGFLFLHQGPIYSTLLVSAAIMVLGVRSKNLALACLLVMVGGVAASESRWHWAYAPGLWAGMLALMQIDAPVLNRANLPRLVRPILFGISGYLGGHIIVSMIRSYQNTKWGFTGFTLVFDPLRTETFNQAFLWDRLLPNPTFSPGVLLGLLWAVGPILAIMFLLRRQGAWRMNALQIAAIAFVSIAFLAVGLTASVKIGGGGDLHNLDMFLITILMLAASVWPEILEFLRKAQTSSQSKLLIYLLLLVPVFYTIHWSADPIQLPPADKVASSLAVIRDEVAAAQQHGEVLFMDQRQLLTFGFFPGLPLVVDYEKKKVMDKAMANNQQYFDQFYADLANHRFSLIVSEPLFQAPLSAAGSFSDENNAWVHWVLGPLLEYYQPLITLKAVNVQLLVPRLAGE
ncbi:MAG: hypothetical protein OEZ02_04165 [Anaerolineae bacterium]|nr:hypothetical protein [Anaerolineae bacterium]